MRKAGRMAAVLAQSDMWYKHMGSGVRIRLVLFAPDDKKREYLNFVDEEPVMASFIVV